MRKTAIILSTLFSLLQTLQAQILVKDLDYDGVMDTVFIECVVHRSYLPETVSSSKFLQISDTVSENYSRIVCLLSSRKFEKIYSRKILIDFWNGYGIDCYITPTHNGFEYFVQYTRNGDKAQFRYNKQTGKVQLIGMSSYDIGRADGNGKGTSSINLLTGNCIGNWYLLEYNLDKLIKIPTIKAKMNFGEIYIEDFNDDTLADYTQQCDSLRYEQGMKIIETNIGKMMKNEKNNYCSYSLFCNFSFGSRTEKLQKTCR